jgi:hypothetical protein
MPGSASTTWARPRVKHVGDCGGEAGFDMLDDYRRRAVTSLPSGARPVTIITGVGRSSRTTYPLAVADCRLDGGNVRHWSLCAALTMPGIKQEFIKNCGIRRTWCKGI